MIIEDKNALAAAVDEALEGLGNEIDGLRHLITELRPAALDDLGLAAALEALARRAQAIDGLDVKTEIAFGRDEDIPPGLAHDGGGRLDPELESTIYRVVQEALTNVSRHAEATSAVISLTGDETRSSRASPTTARGCRRWRRLGPREDGGGFGTGGMQERAELIGGELEWLPAPGKGTIVRLTVPLAGGRRSPSTTRSCREQIRPDAHPPRVQLDAMLLRGGPSAVSLGFAARCAVETVMC